MRKMKADCCQGNAACRRNSECGKWVHKLPVSPIFCFPCRGWQVHRRQPVLCSCEETASPHLRQYGWQTIAERLHADPCFPRSLFSTSISTSVLQPLNSIPFSPAPAFAFSSHPRCVPPRPLVKRPALFLFAQPFTSTSTPLFSDHKQVLTSHNVIIGIFERFFLIGVAL